MKQQQINVLDLTKIEGSGEFQCPTCGASISPDDETEDTYTIVEPKVEKGCLQEIEIRCNRCTSHIHLIGFHRLQKLKA
jgi:hypothetical protein